MFGPLLVMYIVQGAGKGVLRWARSQRCCAGRGHEVRVLEECLDHLRNYPGSPSICSTIGVRSLGCIRVVFCLIFKGGLHEGGSCSSPSGTTGVWDRC